MIEFPTSDDYLSPTLPIYIFHVFKKINNNIYLKNDCKYK